MQTEEDTVALTSRQSPQFQNLPADRARAPDMHDTISKLACNNRAMHCAHNSCLHFKSLYLRLRTPLNNIILGLASEVRQGFEAPGPMPTLLGRRNLRLGKRNSLPIKLRQLLVRQVLLLGATYLACTHIPPAYWTPTAANIKPAIRHFVVRAVPNSVNLRRESGGDSCWHQITNVLRMSTVLLEGASRTTLRSSKTHSKA